MKGFYSIWTKPYFSAGNRKEYWMEDFEILTLILSALEWRKNNGPVKMFADEPAREFLTKMKLISLFDDGVENLTVDPWINPKVFWAAGKLYALRELQEPRAMIDLDLIVWKNMEQFMDSGDIVVIHREELRPEIYPDLSFFRMSPGYQFSRSLDVNALPCNTALLYLKNMEFKNAYVDSAIDFMKNCEEEQENLCHMVFAEQRLIAALAGSYDQKIVSAFPFSNDIGWQDAFTHVWGHKNILKFNYEERTRYCMKCLKRLQEEFPEWYQTILANEELASDFKDYLEELQ